MFILFAARKKKTKNIGRESTVKWRSCFYGGNKEEEEELN